MNYKAMAHIHSLNGEKAEINTMQMSDSDGRYSHDNKAWAKEISINNAEDDRRAFYVNSHPAILDGFNIAKFAMKAAYNKKMPLEATMISRNCRLDIERGISSHYDGMHLNTDFIANLYALYGEERMNYVLATVLEKVGDNDYIVDYNGVKCHALFNWYVCEYYADDIYGVVE